MADMSRPRPPYLHREITRHGVECWYARILKGPRIRINGDYGSAEFMAAYRAAIARARLPAARKNPKHELGTLAWLIAGYRDSGAWLALSPATKRQRENFFLHVIAAAGDAPVAAIQKRHIRQGI
jgi:hypothetical protein